MPLSGDECRRLVDAAHARAAQIGIRVTVAVVDEGGLLRADRGGKGERRRDLAPRRWLSRAGGAGPAGILRGGGKVGAGPHHSRTGLHVGAAQGRGARRRGSERRQAGAGPGLRRGRAARDLISESRATRLPPARRRSGSRARHRRAARRAATAKSAADPCCSSWPPDRGLRNAGVRRQGLAVARAGRLSNERREAVTPAPPAPSRRDAPWRPSRRRADAVRRRGRAPSPLRRASRRG